jgi:predicted nucleic acid-binding protein
MLRLVVDADGLIKLARAGVIEALVNGLEVSVASQVWCEVVEAGSDRGYDDAAVIAGLADRIAVQVPDAVATGMIPHGAARLGAGERGTLALWYERSADAIVSDDRTFLALLGAHGVPFLTPAALLVLLTDSQLVSTDDARTALERLRPYIREDQYRLVAEALLMSSGSSR